MSEPIIDLGIGFLFAVLLAFGTVAAVRMRASRSAVLRLESMPPPVMTVIEADMDQVHSQIAVATRRLEICVEQMKARTTNQLAEIGKTSQTIGRLKAEFARFMTEFNLHPELVKTERRHATEVESLKAEKASVETQLVQAREECGRLQGYIETMKKQVETTWASERMANAVLRERINDVASEVVRVAVALEGLNSPIDSLVAGKTASAHARADDAANTMVLAGENGEIALPGSFENGDGPSGQLIHPIPPPRQRTTRATV